MDTWSVEPGDPGPRPRSAIACLPRSPGVYRFLDVRGRTLYIGRAIELRRRVSSYWSSDMRDRSHLVPMVADIRGIEAVRCDSAHEAAWLERNLLHQALPPWNRALGGQEVPVYIRLNPGRTAPGLRVVHTSSATADVIHFGPYLGGEKARLAVSALHRVLPLAYTGRGLTGLERDLAGKRDVGPRDRSMLVETLSAVLRREPAAVRLVRDQLGVRLARAVDALAFEFAARLQAELDAIDWVSCPQRVTLAEPRDFEVAGWADGMLMLFHFRAGRLSAWTQRRCTNREAGPHLAATPAAWADFARHNAALAAQLTHRCRTA